LKPITAGEMAALEANAEYLGVSLLQLMECAGKAVADQVENLKLAGEVAVYAGTGRNGGDGMVAARHLASRGFQVTLILVGGEERIASPVVSANWKTLKSMTDSVEIISARDSSQIPMVEASTIIDALLGIGVKGRLRPPILQAVQAVNKLKGFKVAVDVPTGIDADTGAVLGKAVKADLTVTFHRVKLGLTKAKKYAGRIHVADIGIPPEAEAYAGPGDVGKVRRSRHSSAHKGDFGRLLVVGGSSVYSGAPALAALAALEVGVDLAYVAAPREAAQAISSYSPNLITFKLEGESLSLKHLRTLKLLIEKCTALILGPGLETRKESLKALPKILALAEAYRKPMLLDADGLKLFAQLKRKAKTACVLTPHRGEFKILTGVEPPVKLEETGEAVRKAAVKFNATILLKAPVDVVSNGGKVKYNRTGGPAMTVGGTGDVLAGVVGGFLAMGVPPFDAAVAGAFINGAAGDLAYKRKGPHVKATDLLTEIPRLIENPMSHLEALQK